MSTLCLCDLSDTDLRVLASLSARPQPQSQPWPAPALRLQPPVSWLRAAPRTPPATAPAEPRP